LAFAESQGIDIRFGDPREEVPGKSIVLPQAPEMIRAQMVDLGHLRRSLIKKAIEGHPGALRSQDITFLAEECNCGEDFVMKACGENL
jgi:hypothetical protein